jgi:nicotinamidase-related amidase
MHGTAPHTDRVAVSSAVLVIDVQEAVLEGCAEADNVVHLINGLVRRARSGGAQVIFIQHEDPADPEMTRGSPGWQLAAALDRLPDEPVIAKTFRDGFSGTSLADRLDHSGVRSIVLTGAHSDYCVQMTALSAVVRGYDVTLVSDAHTARDDGDLAGARIRDLVNDRFASLRSPGSDIAAIPAAAVVF